MGQLFGLNGAQDCSPKGQSKVNKIEFWGGLIKANYKSILISNKNIFQSVSLISLWINHIFINF